MSEKKVEDPHSKSSDRKGLAWLLETFLRRFRNLAFFVLLAPIGVAYIVALSLSTAPAFYFMRWAYQNSYQMAFWKQALYLSTAFATGVLAFWLMMIVVVPILNMPLRPFLKPSKGTWYSINVIPWYYHNALTQLVRYTVLDFLNPTPLNLFFYRLMGMKIGKGTVINTSNISDPAYITLDDYVTIGGSATLFAHYGMKGYLIVGRTHIKKNTTIGLKASVMGDVVIGEGVMVSPHTVILPKSRIEDHAKVGP